MGCAVVVFFAAPLHADELSDIDSLVNKGSYAQALERVNAFLTGRPKDPQGRFLKGIVLTELNKPTEAIQVFTGLTEDYPQLPEPYNNLAVLYASQGQYDKARVALELAIHTHPSYATAHENLGDIYAKLASRAYDKALQLDKGNTGAQNKLAMIKDLFGGKGAGRTVVAKAEPTPVAPPPPAPAKPQPAAVAPPPPEPAKPAEAAKPVEAPKPVEAKPEPAKPVEQPKPVEQAKPIEPPKPVEAPKPPPVEVAKPAEPAKPEPATALAPSRGDQVNAIVTAVESWAKAWSSKDVDGYLGFYGAQFEPGEGMSRKTWEQTRRTRITKPGNISVQVRDVEVVFEGDNVATVRFVQAYRSSNLNSTNRKSLRFVRNGQQWQIQQERVGG